MTQLPDPDSWQGRPHHVTLGLTLPTSHQVPRAKCQATAETRSETPGVGLTGSRTPEPTGAGSSGHCGVTAPWPVPEPAGQPLSRDRTLGGPRIEALEDSCPLVGSWARGGHCRLEGDSFAV
ncbi:hypothetical protein D623_10008446 [Myotis brandtii]|uniref:Uncharacterized protein n=1 Tax=Myotis brandtii TaxID=109478 RepID=S7P6R0_MYOBR|nr:hypothetical protein D623_10008446 [Myotis brandtii]